MNLFAKQTHRTQRMKLWLPEERIGGTDSQGILDGHKLTAIFKKDNQKSLTVQHRELCLMLCGSLDGKGVQGRMDACIYKAESFCCPLEIITTLLIKLIGYTPI